MSAMSRLPDAAPESLLPGAATTISVEAQGRIDALGRTVARIDFADQTSGTGVLLGGRWLLTCHHVLPSRERAGRVKAAIFGYERNAEGQLQGGVSIRLNPHQGFFTSSPDPTLPLDQHDDWTLVRLADDPQLLRFGHAQLFSDAAARARAYARIVQHPGVGPKSCAEGAIGVIQNGRVSYRINTQRGHRAPRSSTSKARSSPCTSAALTIPIPPTTRAPTSSASSRAFARWAMTSGER